MVVKGKSLPGPILGVIGAILLIMAGIVGFGVQAYKEITLNVLTLTWEDVGFDPMLFTVSAILTIVWGSLGLLGAFLGLLGKKFGVFLMLIIGIIATVGMFIPIGTYTLFETETVFLNRNMYVIDPILLLLGGILGIIFID